MPPIRGAKILVAWAVFAALLCPAASGSEASHRHPLAPADTSSPRATLRTFLDTTEEVYQLIQGRGRKVRSGGEGNAAVNLVFQCMDLGDLAPSIRLYSGGESAICLREVLDRIELPPWEQIPDRDAMEQGDDPFPRHWKIPGTDITLSQVEEGPERGAYRFSAATVARAKEFYGSVKHLPYRPGAAEGFYDWYLAEPGWMIPTAWVRALPSWTRATVIGATIWQWAGMVLTLTAGLALMLVIYRIGRSRAVGKRGAVGRYVMTLVWPMAAMLLPLAVKWFIVQQLVIRGTLLAVVMVVLDVLFLLAVIVVVLAAGSRLAEVVVALPNIKPRGLDAQFIRLGCRALSIVVVVIVILEGGRWLGIPLATLLAGAGVGGLAVALAAQDTLRNMFGSMMILLDKPYRVGERIVTKGYDGVVEEIGLRSTKIRLLTGHQASIPNDEMARIDIENIGRRPYIRRIQDIALALETPPDKIEEALRIVRHAAADHDGMGVEFPPRVYFNEFNRDSLNIRIILWFHPPAYWDFLAFSERINLRIMRDFEKVGIRLAPPTTRFTGDAAAVETIAKPHGEEP